MASRLGHAQFSIIFEDLPTNLKSFENLVVFEKMEDRMLGVTVAKQNRPTRQPEEGTHARLVQAGKDKG